MRQCCFDLHRPRAALDIDCSRRYSIDSDRRHTLCARCDSEDSLEARGYDEDNVGAYDRDAHLDADRGALILMLTQNGIYGADFDCDVKRHLQWRRRTAPSLFAQTSEC